MKYIAWLLLLAAILLLPLPGIVKAENPLPVQQAPSQNLAGLEAQLRYLQGLVSNLFLQKNTVSESYIVVDISSNSIVTEKNSDKVYPIASITKLMNAVVAVEHIDMDKTITLNPQMLKPEGSSPSLFANLTINAKNLLQASLIQSANDASEALSYFVGNKTFIQLMNQKAKDLGMQDTVFDDAHGLSPKNISTASDLAKLLAYIYNNHPEILSITKSNDFWLPDFTGKQLKFQNVNNMYPYPEFIGAKAGYLPEAKQTLASVASVDGKPVAIVLLYSKNRKTDALKIVDWVKKNQ